jgi:hypothetical protein
VLYIDTDVQYLVLHELIEIHNKAIECLSECKFDEHSSASKQLAYRIKSQIVQPLIQALFLCEKIIDIGIENVPEEILFRWIFIIESSIKNGRFEFE